MARVLFASQVRPHERATREAAVPCQKVKNEVRPQVPFFELQLWALTNRTNSHQAVRATNNGVFEFRLLLAGGWECNSPATRLHGWLQPERAAMQPWTSESAKQIRLRPGQAKLEPKWPRSWISFL